MTSVTLHAEPSRADVPLTGSGGVKSVLLHVQNDEGLDARLQAALAIARASAGHLTCLQVTPRNAYVGFEAFGTGYVVADLLNQLEQEEEALQARIEAHLTGEDVTWSYERVTSDPAAALVKSAALADLIVVGRSEHSQSAAFRAVATLGNVLMASHTPLLICPKDHKGFDPLGTAVVAWDGSVEAANALRAAMPLLGQAASVHVVSIDEDKTFDFPPLGASEYLSRHGVHSEIVREAKGTRSIGEELVATALSLGASYFVMGAYGHHRVRELLFGGVTRSLLKDCPMPLLVAR